MSLVAYDDSSDEEKEEEEEEEEKEKEEREVFPAVEPQPTQNSVMTSSSQGSNTTQSIPSLDELPEAAFLFSAPSNPSAQNTSRKRESNGNIIRPQSKIPRGGQSTLVHARNVHGRGPTTMLVPPQLSGRSNVVTEDIEKLFVRRRNSTG